MSAAKPRDWAPRIWEGADFFALLRLVGRNRFAVGRGQLYIAGICGGVTFANTALGWVQHGLYGHRLRAVRVDPPPVFVLGHWRTGTTLLHELLMCDRRHASPTTLHCFNPSAFLLTEGVFRRHLNFLAPQKRPMDNMAAGWDRPQEDEFALALLGQPSTYTDCAFPNRPPLDPGALDLSGLTAAQKAAWKRTLLRFLKAVQFRHPGRRLVLKSPPHTARVPTLLELFPGAKFVHVVRDPYVVYASTVHLWNAFHRKHGLQTPRPEAAAAVEAKVLREFRVIYDRLEEAKPLVPAGDFAEVRYEHLTADPVGTVRAVYAGLGLPEFAEVEPAVRAFVDAQQGYEPNRFALTDEQRARVRAAWGDIIERLGYGA